MLEGAAGMFGGEPKPDAASAIDLNDLHANTGQLALENDLLPGALGKARLRSHRPNRPPDPYLFLMPAAPIRNRKPMRKRPYSRSEQLTGVTTLLDIIFIALGAGTIAGLALYASGLARI